MRYIDSGQREAAATLAYWLSEQLKENVLEFRLQTGFFSAGSLGLVADLLEKSREADNVVSMLVGANELTTVRADLDTLMHLVGTPRKNANLGVVSFKGAYFHPKTYHLCRADGSKAAYVGSANFTPSGLALHVEAGLILDTREGDSIEVLDQISAAVDYWFSSKPQGFSLLSSNAILDDLVDRGIVALVRPSRDISIADIDSEEQEDSADQKPSKNSSAARLKPLVKLPALAITKANTLDGKQATEAATNLAPSIAGAQVAALPTVSKKGFPPYLLFAPEAAQPTVGTAALSGATLPGGAAGLIIQLNRDSGRHFVGGKGTSNISVPVETMGSLRFGTYGEYDRPRAEFSLRVRFVTDAGQVSMTGLATNVMGYGFVAGESGHADVRMVVPAAVRDIVGKVNARGWTVPDVGHVALLEWPTATEPAVGLTLIDPKSQIGSSIKTTFDNSMKSGLVVGRGAVWLPGTLVPKWASV